MSENESLKEYLHTVFEQNKKILSSALMSENNFHLIPEPATSNLPGSSWHITNRVSCIVHDCPDWQPPKEFRRKSDYLYLGYWDNMEGMNEACTICGAFPPENLVTCWVLMNTDYISSQGAK